MNTSRSNIGWMLIMPGRSSASKTWSCLSNFMKTTSSNVDEIRTMYLELSSMAW